MKIYHGSPNIVKKPLYKFGKLKNDYGQGFYCTKDIELAKEWSVDYNRDGYSNEYDLDTSNLKILDLNSGDYNILHWLTVLLENREFSLKQDIKMIGKEYLINNFSIDKSKYDVIMGYRADDSYFRFADDFLSNSITIYKLNEAMHLGQLGEQICLKSKNAFDNIRYIKNEKASSEKYFPKKIKRDKIARHQYNNIHDDFSSLYLIDIMRNKVEPNDKRLFI